MKLTEVSQRGEIIMTMYAERAYNSKNRGNKNTKKSFSSYEEWRDAMYEISEQKTKIKKAITQMNDSRAYVQCKNMIDAFSNNVEKNSPDVFELVDMLNKRVNTVLNESQQRITELDKEIKKLKSDHLEESADVLEELNTKADAKVIQYLMKLDFRQGEGMQNAQRRKVGNWVHDAESRIDNLALCKLATLPQCSMFFTEKQKAQINERSQSPACIKYEQAKQSVIEQKQSEMSAEYMRSFLLRKAQKLNNKTSFYFRDNNEGSDSD